METTQRGSWRHRFGVILRDAGHSVGAALDFWDALVIFSWLLLFVGLWSTFHIGIACIVMGAMGLAFGVAGARGAELAALLEAAKRKGGG